MHRVIIDKGVSIAGVVYPHGSVIDPANIVPPDIPPPKDTPAKQVEEYKAERIALEKQAHGELEAAKKAGNQLEDVKPEAASKPAGKEG